MPSTTVSELYPEPNGERRLDGLYLAHRLHERGTPESPFVYANFVMSLDGRIALIESPGEGQGEDQGESESRSFVPKSLTTDSDWLLFQELQAQADCFITHGGYLRALASGHLGNILQIGSSAETARLLEWRAREGLSRQPAIVVASASLDFPMPESVEQHDQQIYIATGEQTARDKVEDWRGRGFEVIFAGDGTKVEGEALVGSLGRLGYKSLYLQAGPQILETTLRDGVLSRLYLTISHQLLGGARFHTLLAGSALEESALGLRSLYLEHGSQGDPGQFFACFDLPPPDRPARGDR